MKAVSVIVPVYNAEKTIAPCLGNLVHQTLEDIEVILVNDASTDGTSALLNACAAQFPDRVTVIDSRKNLGPGGARNLGLDRAQGTYIGFVDADDLADTRMYRMLYEAAIEGDYDIVDCAYLDEGRDAAILMTGDDMTGVLDDAKRSRLIATGGYLWSKLIRRSLFEEPAPLREREHAILEDADILTYLLAVAKSIGNVKEILYRYRATADSASKVVAPDVYCKNILEAMRAVHERVAHLAHYEGIRQAVEYEILQMYSWGVNLSLAAKKDRAPFDADAMLKRLAALRAEIVRERNYKNNPFVREKIPAQDIKIMISADKQYGPS